MTAQRHRVMRHHAGQQLSRDSRYRPRAAAHTRQLSAWSKASRASVIAPMIGLSNLSRLGGRVAECTFHGQRKAAARGLIIRTQPIPTRSSQFAALGEAMAGH
jgi:hypothetical protein